MAAHMSSRVDDLEVEIILGCYEQVLFGYKLTAVNDTAVLEVSFTDKSHAASVRSLAVSKHNVLASGGADESIFLFDLSRRRARAVLSQHTGTVRDIHFYKDFMISCDESGDILIWRTSKFDFECVRTLRGHKGAVISVSVHPTGKLLLSLSQDKTLRTWNLVTGSKAYVTNHTVVHDFVLWSPLGDKYLLASARCVDVCSVATAGSILTIDLPGRIHAVKFFNDRYFVVGCEGGNVCLINLEDGAIVHEIELETSRVKALDVKLMENDQHLLALTTSEGHVQLYLIKLEIDDISCELIAATKTALRPISLALSVRTPRNGDVGQKNSSQATKLREEKKNTEEKEPKQADKCDNSIPLSPQSQDTDQIAKKPTANDTADNPKKKGKKKRKMNEADPAHEELDSSRQSPEKTGKFKPRDSVKIAKSKAKQFKERRSKSNSTPKKAATTT